MYYVFRQQFSRLSVCLDVLARSKYAYDIPTFCIFRIVLANRNGHNKLSAVCVCVCVRYQRGEKALSRKREDRGTFQKEIFLLSSAKSTPHPRAPPNPTTNLNATIITSHSSIHHALFSLSGSLASFLLSR